MSITDSVLSFFSLALALITLSYECSLPISFVILDVLASTVHTAVLLFSPDPSKVLRIVQEPSRLLKLIPRPSLLLGSGFLPIAPGAKKVEISLGQSPISRQLSPYAKQLSQESGKVLLPVSTLTDPSSVAGNEVKLENVFLDLSKAPQVHANHSGFQSKSRETDGSDLVESLSTIHITSDASDMGIGSSQVYNPRAKTPATTFEIKCHPEVDDVCAEVDGFFIKYWPFKDQEERDLFMGSGLCLWACYAMPGVDSDRVVDACKVNVLLFLLDDIAENKSLEEGKAFYQRLVPLAMGKAQPNRDDPVEWITYDVWASMRAKDAPRTKDVFQTSLLCIMAQVDNSRSSCPDMGSLLRQREKEGGCAFVEATMRWGMCLTIEPKIYQACRPILALYAKHGVTVNDIESYEKEMIAWNKDQKEGARVLNIVQLLSHDSGLSPASAKRTLFIMCREWELDFWQMTEKFVAEHKDCEELKPFFKGLEWILSGNEHWSATTARYHGW